MRVGERPPVLSLQRMQLTGKVYLPATSACTCCINSVYLLHSVYFLYK